VQETRDLPLVVDLDGTLTLTDTLAESVVQVVRRNPVNLLRLPYWLLAGRSGFKEQVAAHADFGAESLPYREPLLDYLRTEKARGRRIVLATAAHHSIAARVSDHLGLFDDVCATDGGVNLKGEAKLARVHEQVGAQFVYAGDSRADLPIWHACGGAILAGVAPAVGAAVRAQASVEREFCNPCAGPQAWLRALRVHQWLKNLLLFVPLFTAFAFFDLDRLATLALAFIAMSLGASATYIANDLWDLDNDRRHPRKRLRPFASGQLPITHGVGCALLLLALSCGIGFAASPAFAGMLALYLVLTTAYSWFLKTRVLADVIMLSLLYTLRIVAGSIAVGISISHWLLAFSVFTFLSLALVKRCAELVSLRQRGQPATSGRDYQVTDLEVLWPLGIGASLAAVIVFGLFINAPDTMARYATPHLLWGAALGFIYLFSRLWVSTVRGEMHDDPIVHLLDNRRSLAVVLLIIAVMLAAHFLTLG
jgi:4-hydroxybenzoate polyprenyltransferase